jgi:hypothetical protein
VPEARPRSRPANTTSPSPFGLLTSRAIAVAFQSILPSAPFTTIFWTSAVLPCRTRPDGVSTRADSARLRQVARSASDISRSCFLTADALPNQGRVKVPVADDVLDREIKIAIYDFQISLAKPTQDVCRIFLTLVGLQSL